MTTSTLTLTNFLLERLADDEAAVWEVHALHCASVTVQQGCDCGHPARVLAECEAKRRIVEDVDAWFADQGTNDPAGILQALAAVYADHPDYREEWRP